MENSIAVLDSDEDAARELDMQDESQDMLSTQVISVDRIVTFKSRVVIELYAPKKVTLGRRV